MNTSSPLAPAVKLTLDPVDEEKTVSLLKVAVDVNVPTPTSHSPSNPAVKLWMV